MMPVARLVHMKRRDAPGRVTCTMSLHNEAIWKD